MTKFGFLSLKFGDPCHVVGMPARCGTGAHAASTRDSASRDVRIKVIVCRSHPSNKVPISARLLDFRENSFTSLAIERIGDARLGAPRKQALARGDGTSRSRTLEPVPQLFHL